MNNLVNISFGGEGFSVITSPEHEWLIDSATLALAYGIKESGIRMHKAGHKAELVLNKHFIEVEANSLIVNSVSNIDTPHTSANKTFWTKKGVVRLGFFIKSEQAAHFRDFAEDLVINQSKNIAPALPTDYETALEALLKEVKAKKAAEEAQRLAELEAQKQRALVQELAPHASYACEVLDSSSSYTTTQMAKELNMRSAEALNAKLVEMKVQFMSGDIWVLHAKYSDKGYQKRGQKTLTGRDGRKWQIAVPKWTEKGREFLHCLFNTNYSKALKPIDE